MPREAECETQLQGREKGAVTAAVAAIADKAAGANGVSSSSAAAAIDAVAAAVLLLQLCCCAAAQDLTYFILYFILFINTRTSMVFVNLRYDY